MTDKANPHMEREPPDDLGSTEIGRVGVVGVGASAGGLEALRQFLGALPSDTGKAFVLVSHLAPEHTSAMATILQRATAMPVVEVIDGVAVEPNRVYVIPPGRLLSISGGTLELASRDSAAHPRVVDQFFESLADDLRNSAIGVVLSGTANDGTQGLESIKAVGGTTFAQDDSAQFDGMPHSAIESGCVDFVLPPDLIAREIARLSFRDQLDPDDPSAANADDATYLNEILELLLRISGIDFTGYKSSTLLRRVRRRMRLEQIDTLADYVVQMRRQPAQVTALHDDILIGVTSFFRNPPAFAAIASQVLPTLFGGRDPRDPLRLWVVGCSTGQEAYSLAILLTEFTERHNAPTRIQIFATDLNANAIEHARRGVYPKEIAEDVSAERLQRFFVESEGGYRITKSIREACVFSRHNLLTDPPFSRIDLLSCRNLLIYLEPTLQRRVMPILHYALRPNGFLWLGGAEALGAYRTLFDTLDSKHKIYTKHGGGGRPVARASRRAEPSPSVLVPIPPRSPDAHGGLYREAERILLTRFAPPAVVVSNDLEIRQYRGDTSDYLTPAPGQASLNLLKMLREGLLVPVHSAIISAGKSHAPVRAEDLSVKTRSGYERVSVEVVPIREGAAMTPNGFLILFESAQARANETPPAIASTEAAATLADRERADLIRELTATREYLQRVIEQQEAANEQLQSASEEVQSANEELQSTNEELETSKEEIQSSNEELSIYNDELNSRNAELLQLNSDLNVVLDSVNMAIVIFGPDLEVRRFTAAAERLFALSGHQQRRRFDPGAVAFDMHDLAEQLRAVMETRIPLEREVRDRNGRWYSLRLRPYVMENRIEGAIAVLVDVEAIKSAERYQESIIATVREPLLVLDTSLRVRTANAAFLDAFQMARGETEGRLLYQLGNGEWDVPQLRDQLLRVLPDDEPVTEFRIDRDFARSGRKTLHISAARLLQSKIETPLILVSIRDVTEVESILRDSEERFKTMADNISQFTWMADAEGWIFWFNRRWYDYTGTVLSDVQGDGWRRFHHPDHQQRVQEGLRRAREASEPWEDTIPILGKHGGYRWFLSRMNPAFDSAGNVIRWFGTHTDVTEQREHAASLLEADRRKDEFIAMLAHELRNPLAPIVNALKTIRSGDDGSVQIQTASQVMQRQVDHLVRLVDDLLDVGRVASGRIRLRKQPIELNSIFTSVIDATRPSCVKKDQTLAVDLPPTSARVDGDAIRLAQVVENLLNNASKFTPHGGRIDVVVGNERDRAVIRVRDSGIGLEQHQLARIFDMFTQVDTSLERSTSGLGIGLTLCKTIVELHGGTIAAQSDGLGKGCEFTVRLPTLNETVPLSQPSGASATALVPHRILVVDDNRDGAESLARVLELSGQDTRVSADGIAALTEAEAFRPDVVLLDIGLPKLNGFEVARRIRQAPWGQSMILIAVTGWGQEEHRRASSDAGFDAHLVKPVDPIKLVRLLASLTSND